MPTLTFLCPINTCRAENIWPVETCAHCGAPLAAYAHLAAHPAHLFNQGLQEARARNFRRARDLFAAVVYWCPRDREARNALAAACFELGDREEARRHWLEVLRHYATDPSAEQGLQQLSQLAAVKPAHRKLARLHKVLFAKRRRRSRRR
ncbi:hypothetical protein EPA93_38120 [Ktedonosporobacter rubrisoli]|uniref:Tetratricopeptide repeat protein n=1 Tax=Ktedonosporobacter rubrisoli TaxID=2509675 RepID=A0A4P6K038_KTERU|nr:hypothetical protein [Ktedonosporobacter rubrisoli]QBD81477.1 hypothetical protein EPA93_38120 [Ktedonosporobacter rubrisoli]